MQHRAVLLVTVCVYGQKHIFIKSLDRNKTLPTLIITDVANPRCHTCAARCNSQQEIDICMFVEKEVKHHRKEIDHLQAECTVVMKNEKGLLAVVNRNETLIIITYDNGIPKKVRKATLLNGQREIKCTNPFG